MFLCLFCVAFFATLLRYFFSACSSSSSFSSSSSSLPLYFLSSTSSYSTSSCSLLRQFCIPMSGACACTFPDMGRWRCDAHVEQVGSNPISGCHPKRPGPDDLQPFFSSFPLLFLFLLPIPFLLFFSSFFSSFSSSCFVVGGGEGGRWNNKTKRLPAGAGSGAEPQVSNGSPR